VYRCYWLVAVPLFMLFIATLQLADWLPALLIWLSKPWLDRTILFALSRSLFGQKTSVNDLWASARPVWASQWLQTFVRARLSASRSFTAPVVQLEGLEGRERRERITVLASRHRGAARVMTQIFATAEFALFVSLLLVPAWLLPHQATGGWSIAQLAQSSALLSTLAYACTVCFLEPFYVAAGFGMYINRRVELEAWDIEQEFRRAFAA
jgi:hypothetical protein